jgi:hypothetical protein
VTSRDRLAALVVGSVVLLAVFWFFGLSPKRKDAHDLGAKISETQQRLDAARQAATAGTAARDRYGADYATVAKLGKAVPADDDILSLVYQLDHVSTGTHIDFRSIKLESTGSSAPAVATPAAQAAAVGQAAGSDAKTTGAAPADGSSGASTTASSAASSSSSTSSTASTTPATGVPASQTAAAGLPPGSAVGSAGFPTMPFSFVFDGSFFNMENFFSGIQRLAAVGSGDKLSVRGRLLTVDAFALTASRLGFPKVKASVNATAYLVPDTEGATAGATAQGPGTAAAPAASTGGTGSPAAPAAATSITGGAR